MKSHVLNAAMLESFESGVLNPLLEVVKRDRDLILEFRGQYASIYCKGQRIDIRSCGGGNYQIETDNAFLKTQPKLDSKEAAAGFVEKELPHLKQAIATHQSCGREIEFEQALIRANNLEPTLPTDYFAVDRQVPLGDRSDQVDVLGIYWPAKSRGFHEDVALALIEVKFALAGGVEEIAAQALRYYQYVQVNIKDMAADAQELLRQKLRLGLITGASRDALRKLEILPVSADPKRVKIVLALIDCNPRSSLLNRSFDVLGELRSQVQVFHLGLGLFEEKGQPILASNAAEA